MSPVNNLRRSPSLGEIKQIAQSPDAEVILKTMAQAKMLDTEVKSWLKLEHPDLYQAITNIDSSGGRPPATDPWANYPAGTRYAVIDKNEL